MKTIFFSLLLVIGLQFGLHAQYTPSPVQQMHSQNRAAIDRNNAWAASRSNDNPHHSGGVGRYNEKLQQKEKQALEKAEANENQAKDELARQEKEWADRDDASGPPSAEEQKNRKAQSEKLNGKADKARLDADILRLKGFEKEPLGIEGLLEEAQKDEAESIELLRVAEDRWAKEDERWGPPSNSRAAARKKIKAEYLEVKKEFTKQAEELRADLDTE